MLRIGVVFLLVAMDEDGGCARWDSKMWDSGCVHLIK